MAKKVFLTQCKAVDERLKMKQIVWFMVCFFMYAHLCAMGEGYCDNAVYCGICGQLPGQNITVRSAVFSEETMHLACALQEKEPFGTTEALVMTNEKVSPNVFSANASYTKRIFGLCPWKIACDATGSRLAYALVGERVYGVGIAGLNLQELLCFCVPSFPRGLSLLENGSPLVSTSSNGIVLYTPHGQLAALFDGDYALPDKTGGRLLAEKNYPCEGSSSLRLYDIVSQKCIAGVGISEKINNAYAFSPNNKVIYAGTTTGNIIMMPSDMSAYVSVTLLPSIKSPVLSIVTSKTMEHLVTAHRFNGMTDVYDVRNSLIPCHKMVSPGHDVCLTSFITAERYLCGVCRTGTMHAWQLQ